MESLRETGHRVRLVKGIMPAASGWRVFCGWMDGNKFVVDEKPVVGWGIVTRQFFRDEAWVEGTARDEVELLVMENCEVIPWRELAELAVPRIVPPGEQLDREELRRVAENAMRNFENEMPF